MNSAITPSDYKWDIGGKSIASAISSTRADSALWNILDSSQMIVFQQENNLAGFDFTWSPSDATVMSLIEPVVFQLIYLVSRIKFDQDSHSHNDNILRCRVY